MPGMPSEGQEGQDSAEGEEGSDAGADPSSERSLESGGEFPEGDPEDVESGQQDDVGEASLPGSLLPGTDDSDQDSGWEVSNQLPFPGGESSEDEEQGGIGDLPGEFEQGGGGQGTYEDGELQRALETMDGEIMDERMEGKSRANEQAAHSSGLLGDFELEDGGVLEDASGGGQSADTEEDGEHVGRDAGDGQQNLPPTVRAVGDSPDARDGDIIARQLREAAMAETDPDLKEELWEEHRKYVEGKK